MTIELTVGKQSCPALISRSPVAPQPSLRRGRGSNKFTWHVVLRGVVALRQTAMKGLLLVSYSGFKSCNPRKNKLGPQWISSSTPPMLVECVAFLTTQLCTPGSWQLLKRCCPKFHSHSQKQVMSASLSFSAFSPKGSCPQSNLQKGQGHWCRTLSTKLAVSIQDCKHARHSHTAIFQVPKPGVQNSDFMLECFKIQEGSVQCVNFKTIPFATHDFRSHVMDCTLPKAKASTRFEGWLEFRRPTFDSWN